MPLTSGDRWAPAVWVPRTASWSLISAFAAGPGADGPLTSHDVIVQSIAATTARTGLSVHAELDTDTYQLGIKIRDAQMQALHDTGTLHRHDWHPEWNYTLNPSPE